MKNPDSVHELLAGIRPAEEETAAACRRRWDSLAMPLGGLGLLQESVARMAAALGAPPAEGFRRAVGVFCADNGVVAEGVTQTDSSVTAVVARNLCLGQGCLSHMARAARADVFPVDMGIRDAFSHPRLISRRILPVTGNIALGPAMSRAQAEEALLAGALLAGEWKRQGYALLAAGEMGTGNTTTAAAVRCALLGLPPERAVGRGAGLSDQGLARKREAVRRALAVNRPDPADPLDVLSKVGGLDIAGMAGLFLGGAYYRIPVAVDGLISGAAALLAVRLAPAAGGFLLGSHCSAEPAAGALMEALGLPAPLQAGMHQGEGTGAAALFPLLDMALAVYWGMGTFEENGMVPYQPLGGGDA